jgi:CheY-like chemotaxis protein
MTPQGYLSWSQLSLWESSPERYKEHYFYGKKTPINRGMAFGKKMADGLERDELTGDVVLDLMMERIPKFEVMDKEFRTELKNGKDTIIILAKPDTMKADMTAFKEYKTGVTRWTRKKVDECGQITFYATAMWLKTGKIPKDIELVDVATKAALDGKIEATGDITRHPTVRTMTDILKMVVRMKKCWAGISKAMEEII